MMRKNLVILEKQTYEKYGYWPRDLSNGSNKRIIYKCSKCKENHSTLIYNVVRRVTSLCKNCVKVEKCRKSHIRTRRKVANKIKNTKPAVLTNDLLIKLYCRYCVVTTGTGRHLRLQTSNNKANLKGDYIDIYTTSAILKALSPKKKLKNTKEFKKSIRKYIETLPFVRRFDIANKIINQISIIINQSSIRINRKSCNWQFFFNNLNMIIETSKDDDIIIKKGSFFIDGRWIHVG